MMVAATMAFLEMRTMSRQHAHALAILLCLKRTSAADMMSRLRALNFAQSFQWIKAEACKSFATHTSPPLTHCCNLIISFVGDDLCSLLKRMLL